MRQGWFVEFWTGMAGNTNAARPQGAGMDREYVFEQVDIGDGWEAIIAVGDFGEEGYFVTRYLAFDAARGQSASDRNHPACGCCEAWLAANASRIPELHAEQVRKVRGRRALVAAVETAEPEPVRVHDGALAGHTMDIVRKCIDLQFGASLRHPYRVNSPYCDNANTSADADWRDR